MTSYNPDLKAANKEAVWNTVKNMRKKQQDLNETNYNPALLGELVIALCGSKITKRELKSILNAKKPDSLNMVRTRNFLYATVMIFGNGQQPGTIENSI